MKWPFSKSKAPPPVEPPKPTFESAALGGGVAVRKDSSFGEFNGVPAYWFARAIEPGAMAAMWQPMAESVWVQRAIKLVSLPISAVSLDFYPRGAAAMANPRSPRARRYDAGRTVYRSADATLELPQVRAFLEEPVEGLSYADFVEASIGWMKLDECFWLVGDDAIVPFPKARKEISKLIIARPNRMRQIIEGGKLTGWNYTDLEGKAWSLLPEQVIQLKFWNPYNPWRGLGEYSSARIAAEADHLCGKFERNLAANNGDTGPFIIAKSGVPSDAQREQMVAELRAKRQAQLRGDFKPIFLTGDISVEDPSIKSVDAAFIASRLAKRHEIYAAFGVPMSMADIVASYSIGSASDWFRLIMETCIPNGAKFCGALGQLILRQTGQGVEVLQNWDEHPVMQNVRRERMTSADTLFSKGMPMEQIDEYLDLGLPPYEGKEIGYVPINIVPVGQEEEEPSEDESPDDLSETKPGKDETPEAVKQMIAALRSPKVAERKVRNGKAIWDGHMRLRQKTVRLFQSKASKTFMEYRGKAMRLMAAMAGKKAVDVHKGLLDVIFNRDSFGVSLFNNLNPVIHSGLESAVTELLDEIGKAEDPWRMPPPEVLRFIAERENKIKDCSQTAYDQLKTAIEAAVKDGKSIAEMTGDIRGVFNDLSKFEAKRIAMTETSAVYGKGRHEAMAAVGIEFKCWLSSHGPNVREWHAEAEDQYGDNPIPVDQPFIVGGEKLMHPGDPAGSAANVINCHCIELPSAGPKDQS